MFPHVGLVHLKGLESFPADGTVEQLVTRVDFHVGDHLVLTSEFLATGGAERWRRLHVAFHVAAQVEFLGESLPTNAAGEGLPTRVASHMGFEMIGVCECLPTEAAGD